MITKEQVKTELDHLENTQALHQVYQLIRQLQMLSATPSLERSNQQEQQIAMNDFFGMHRELGTDSVEEELRCIRQGRRGLLNGL